MKNNPAVHHGRGLKRFLAQHGADVTGVISGYDRLRLRGSLRYFYQPTFLFRHLCNVGVLLKNFGAYATSLSERVRDAVQSLCRRLIKNGRRYRALNPWSPDDAALLGATSDLAERRRRTGGVTRLLALLRAHSVIQKVPCTHRYMVTPRGRELISAILFTRQASVPQSLKLAA